MNIELVLTAIKEVREARQNFLIECIKNGAEQSEVFQQMSMKKYIIDSFERTVEEIEYANHPD